MASAQESFYEYVTALGSKLTRFVSSLCQLRAHVFGVDMAASTVIVECRLVVSLALLNYNSLVLCNSLRKTIQKALAVNPCSDWPFYDPMGQWLEDKCTGIVVSQKHLGTWTDDNVHTSEGVRFFLCHPEKIFDLAVLRWKNLTSSAGLYTPLFHLRISALCEPFTSRVPFSRHRHPFSFVCFLGSLSHLFSGSPLPLHY